MVRMTREDVANADDVMATLRRLDSSLGAEVDHKATRRPAKVFAEASKGRWWCKRAIQSASELGLQKEQGGRVLWLETCREQQWTMARVPDRE